MPELTTLEEIIKEIEAEPEFPGRPKRLLAHIDKAIAENDRDFLLDLCRHAVSLTKLCIIKRLREKFDA